MLQPKHLNISGLPCSVVAGDGQLGPLCDSTATVMRDVEAHRAEISKLRCGKLDRIRKYRGLSWGVGLPSASIQSGVSIQPGFIEGSSARNICLGQILF